MELTRADYVRWRALWDEMMRQYCPARDTAFALALDLVGQLVKGPTLRVVDVCCGAGTFVEQVLARFPHARITGVDRSARSLHIAQTVIVSDQASWTQQDCTATPWTLSLEEGSCDVAFLGWATHEIAPWYLPDVYAQVARYLRPDGLLVNVDFMWNLQPGLREQVLALTRSRMTTEWQAFNQRFEQYPAIQQFALVEHEQRTRWNEHHGIEVHRQALATAGFKFADEVWRYLNHAMLLAIR